MIDLGQMDGDSGSLGNSVLAHYLINETDLRWLDICDDYLPGPPTNESVTTATKEGLKANPRGHIDPFELLIDADICDTQCEPRL
jgi:hypothetical protein